MAATAWIDDREDSGGTLLGWAGLIDDAAAKSHKNSLNDGL